MGMSSAWHSDCLLSRERCAGSPTISHRVDRTSLAASRWVIGYFLNLLIWLHTVFKKSQEMSHQKSLELVYKGSKVYIKVKPAFSKYNVRRNRNFLQFGGYIFLCVWKSPYTVKKILVPEKQLISIVLFMAKTLESIVFCEYIREAFTAIPMVVNDSLKVKCSKNKRSCRKVTRRRRAIKCQIALWKAFGVCVIFICSFWFLPWWLLDYVFHTVGKYEKNVTLQLTKITSKASNVYS